MINAQELRLGNYIWYKKDGSRKWKVGQVLIGDFSAIKFDHPGGEYSAVEITPEILIKCGFEKSGDGETWFVGHFGFCLVHDGEDWCMKPRYNDNVVIAYFKHLHELQNLIFCITGKELEINI